jgi:hypothetical protein
MRKAQNWNQPCPHKHYHCYGQVNKMILAGVGLSEISFVLAVKEETVLAGLERAYQKAVEINKALLKELTVTEVRLDEMWSFVKRKISKRAESEIETPQGTTDGCQRVWISYVPRFRLILVAVVGPRTFRSALRLI